MKILVTGSTGFIGKFLTKKLSGQGHEVVGIDINAPNERISSGSFLLGSVMKKEDISKAIDGVDVIIHLAAKHHDFGISRDEFFEFNVGSTKNLLDCAAKAGIKKFIFYSSVAVYGNHKAYTTEDTLPTPENDYGESKLAAEKVINTWMAEDRTRQAVIIRPTVVFGPENYANMYNLINTINKKRFLFIGKGDNVKSVAYVENLVDATIFLMERMKQGVDVFNYSDYPQMTTKNIVKVITKHLSCNMPKLKLPLGLTLAVASIFDFAGKITGYNFPITAKRIKKFNTATHHKSEKIRKLGFRLSVDLSDGFKRMIEWYLKNGNNEHGKNN